MNNAKGTEENNRMGKTRDLFKNIRDTKGTSLHECKDGHNKGQKLYGLNRNIKILTRGGNNSHKNYAKKKKKKTSWPRLPWWFDHPPRARYPGMWSQVGHRKYH